MTDRGISFQNSVIYEIPRNQLYRVSCNPCLISYVKTLLRFSRIYARKLLGRYSPFCLSIVPKSNVCTTAKNVLFAEWKFIISTLLQLFGWLYVRRNIFKIATLSFTSSARLPEKFRSTDLFCFSPNDCHCFTFFLAPTLSVSMSWAGIPSTPRKQ